MASVDAKFRSMLTELAAGIRQEELEIMIFRCNVIPKRRQEQITSAIKLWEALEERDMISAVKTGFLRELLWTSTQGRRDLLKILDDYAGEFPAARTSDTDYMVHNFENVKGAVTLTKGMEYVADNLGKNWKQVARMLGLQEHEIDEIVENHSRNFREQCHQCIRYWKTKSNEDATDEELIKALRTCQLNLTADTVASLMNG